MIQNNIRQFGGVPYTNSEADALTQELNNRTKSSQSAYNSIDELATKVKVLEEPIVKTKTSGASYTFNDGNRLVTPLFTSNSAVIATVSLGVTVGTSFILSQWGDGEVSIVAAAGVTLRFPADELAKTANKYSFIELIVVDTNEVAVIGRLKKL